MLEPMVQAFFRQLPGCESIDELPMTAVQRGGKKADFFLFQRRIIAEVKEFVDDREAAVRDVLDTLRNQGMIRVERGVPLVQEVLRDHPERVAINARLFSAATSCLETHFREANQQIRETRRHWVADEALGILVLVNESVDILDPKAVAGAVNRLLGKRSPDGTPRFPMISSVVFITTAHRIVEDGGKRKDLVISMGLTSRQHDEDLRAAEQRIKEGWAAFRGLPVRDGGKITPEQVRSLSVEGRRPPAVL